MHEPNQECVVENCTQPTPDDMPAIEVDGVRCCSPECAREWLGTVASPSHIGLHDPQFQAPRDAFGVDKSVTYISTAVDSTVGAHDAVDTIADAVQGPFRAAESPPRSNIKVSKPVLRQLQAVKEDSETWDECLSRLAQLDRATQQ